MFLIQKFVSLFTIYLTVYICGTMWPDRENGKLSVPTELPFPLSQHPISISRKPHTHKRGQTLILTTSSMSQKPPDFAAVCATGNWNTVLLSARSSLVHCYAFKAINKLVSGLYSFNLLWFIICQWIEFLRGFCISGNDYWSMYMPQDPQINASWTMALKLALLNPEDKIYQSIQKKLRSKAKGARVEVCYFEFVQARH